MTSVLPGWPCAGTGIYSVSSQVCIQGSHLAWATMEVLTIEIGQCHTSGLFLPGSWLLHV